MYLLSQKIEYLLDNKLKSTSLMLFRKLDKILMHAIVQFEE